MTDRLEPQYKRIEVTYAKVNPEKPQRRCVCGCSISHHIFNYDMEEFAGCPDHPECPSHEAFFELKEEQ
jgi:hypothetical protein